VWHVFSFQYCDRENFPKKIAKLEEFTRKKHIFPQFSHAFSLTLYLSHTHTHKWNKIVQKKSLIVHVFGVCKLYLQCLLRHCFFFLVKVCLQIIKETQK
jgi:hypothetical protein